MPAKIPLLDHMLIRWKGILFLPFSAIRVSYFNVLMFCQYKNPPLSNSTVCACPQLWVFALCNHFDYVQVQGWWCNLVLFPAGSQTSEQADRKSRGNSDMPCENGVRTHSRCSQTHFPSGLFKARNEGCSLRLHVITVKLSSQNTSLALKWAMISEVIFCALRVFLCSVHVSSHKSTLLMGGFGAKE